MTDTQYAITETSPGWAACSICDTEGPSGDLYAPLYTNLQTYDICLGLSWEAANPTCDIRYAVDTAEWQCRSCEASYSGQHIPSELTVPAPFIGRALANLHAFGFSIDEICANVTWAAEDFVWWNNHLSEGSM